MADLTELVAKKIAEMQPYLERSGGHVELVDVEDGVARVRLWFTRPGPSRLVASLQLKSGLERLLRDEIVPPYTVLGWDQPEFKPVELPVAKDGA
ncbi:MAG: NifU family protein [Chloroflexi bacterium]|nr:MAG: NifU family protein [Chloroflexota bacterium]